METKSFLQIFDVNQVVLLGPGLACFCRPTTCQRKKGTRHIATTTETTTTLTVPETPELQKAAIDIAWAHQTAQRVAKDALLLAIWCGKRLHDVQAILAKDGRFGDWLEQNLASIGIGRTTAYKYLAVYDRCPRELQKALPETTAELIGMDAPKLPAASLTGVYREYGMVKTVVHKPSDQPLTPRQAYGGLTRFRDRVQKTDFSKLSAADRAKLRAAVAEVLGLIDAVAPAKAAA